MRLRELRWNNNALGEVDIDTSDLSIHLNMRSFSLPYLETLVHLIYYHSKHNKHNEMPPTWYWMFYLITPLIYDWHVDVIHENSHPFACWGAICCTHSLIDIALDSSLLENDQTLGQRINNNNKEKQVNKSNVSERSLPKLCCEVSVNQSNFYRHFEPTPSRTFIYVHSISHHFVIQFFISLIWLHCWHWARYLQLSHGGRAWTRSLSMQKPGFNSASQQ